MSRFKKRDAGGRVGARVTALVAALALIAVACGADDTPADAPEAPAETAAEDVDEAPEVGEVDAEEAVAAPDDCNGYPDRPIEIIVPYTAGGGTDQIGRLFAQIASLYTDVPVRHQTMPGAGAALGSRFVAEAEPDGYTLSLGTSASIVSVGMLEDAGYDKDSFEAVSIITAPSFVFVVAPDSPFETWDDLFEYSLENPGEITYGVSGAGGSPGILVSGLEGILGFEWTLVPFDGSAAGVLAAAAGDVDLSVPSLGSALDVIDAGTVRPLIQTAPERSEFLPDTPTFAETEGADNFTFTIWRTIAAPAGTPDCVIDYLADISEQVSQNEDWIELSTNIEGEAPLFLGPDEARAEWDSYAAFLEPLVPELRGD